MAELKETIKYYENMIVQDQLSQDGNLVTNFDKLNRKLFTPPPSQYFPGSGYRVSFRMMTTMPPYVGVDFGGGANAVFNPTFMVMVYAD